MSKCTYNSIRFDEILTKSMAFRAVYSDDGLEYRHTEVILSFSAIVSLKIPPAADSIGGTNTDADVGATIRRIRYALTAPRKQLTFYVNPDDATPLLQTPPTLRNPRDPINGPLPQSLTITRIDGTAAIAIDYSIKTAIVEMSTDSRPPQISSHRWSESVSLDENFYSRKTRNGMVYCRGDLKSEQGEAVDIDDLREFFAPAIPKGFKLESASYSIDPDGLKMTYTHVFKEVYLQPPWPATKASGHFAISSNIGAIRLAECTVRLEGGKTTRKDQLLRTAILVVCTKLRGNGKFAGRNNKVSDRNPVFKGMSVREGLFENWVEVSAKAQLPATKKRLSAGVPASLEAFGIDVGGENPPNLGIRGTAGLLIRAAQKYLDYDINQLQEDDWKANKDAPSPAFKVT